MTALPSTQVVEHRTRAGRLDYVTVEREPDGVVRVLGWYPSRTAAQRAVDHAADTAPLAVRAVAAAIGPFLRPLLVRPGLIR